jgi:hypothetical protein
MSVQRLHAFEKTSIQARHTIKRLEMLSDTARTEFEKELADELLRIFKEVRSAIPDDFQDVDLKQKE